MVSEKVDYVAHFGLALRPFSLTPDPCFYFRSRSHARVFDALSAALARRECLMLVLGDLGVGKTTLCRTLLEPQERTWRAALVGNALLSPEDLLRVMLQDLGAISKEELDKGVLPAANHDELVDRFTGFQERLRAAGESAVMIIDEAHSLPPETKEQVIEIACLHPNRDRVMQFLLAGQPAIGGRPMFSSRADQRLSVRARLLPLERDECERYTMHRLAVAGRTAVTFSSPAIEVIYRLSGGIPRLINLLADRALQETANTDATLVEPKMIDSAASALDLMRLRPKRFRWYGAR
jgi:general secretion pathway protein A